MRILISGACGRMGRAVAACADNMGIEIACGVDPCRGETSFPLYADFASVTDEVDCIIDFSRPDALEDLLSYAVTHGIPAVICSTGFSDEQLKQIDAASKVVPVFRSANMSIGIAVLRKLAGMASQMLGDDFDVEIVEAHHNQKVDAPSGTALMLFNEIKDLYNSPRERKDGRSGACRRKKTEIGMHALRGGTVAGEHAVCYFGPMERIELRHSAEDRSVFAVGSLRAAAFLIDQNPGLYNMDDMLRI